MPGRAATQSGTQRPVSTLGFPWPAYGQIELPVSVQGADPLAFLLDTGAEYSIVSSALAGRLGLATVRQLGRDFADDVTLTFGGITMSGQRVMVMPFDSYRRQGRAIEGLIGFDFFARYVVDVDFEKAAIVVWRPGHVVESAASAPLPFEFVRRLPVVRVQLVFPSRPPLTARLLVDTGASQAIILRQPFAHANRLLDLAPSAETHTANSLASGTLRLVRLPAERLVFGPWTFSAPFVRAHLEPVGSGGYIETDGVLGNELLRRFRVRIDYSRQVVMLEPNRRLHDPFTK